MGIPKFFRWISERYPLTSQLLTPPLPEFDNLYLDFNGIIHNCSHPPSTASDPHFRLSEEEITTNIFAYVDILFGKIKPKKLFFIAVDGVAPRAKMNQQRSRRFRTAQEAKELREKAERKGEVVEEGGFDSNCITPGTPFMTRLSANLRYFIAKKISEDSAWSSIEVVLSGHEVPGEGEHKIMEYIRLSRAQPDYNPNLRHCLYGLDADLIMLGLVSHDPHFCLLREEVKFGAGNKKKTSVENQSFYLLHLSLLREYIDLEFASLHSSSLPFEYSLERVLDDFILLSVFVGNDFLPHLPDLHIHEAGLERLFELYKEVLPRLGGYLNEAGTISLPRLQILLNEMVKWDEEVFLKESGDVSWLNGKARTPRKPGKPNGELVLTKSQSELFTLVRDFLTSPRQEVLTIPNTLPARNRAFLTTLCNDLGVQLSWDAYDDDDNNVITISRPHSSYSGEDREDDWEDDSEEDDEEGTEALQRVLSKYASAKIDEEENIDERLDETVKRKMDLWRESYYRGKLGFSISDTSALQALVFRYVEGLQWVMYYYYSGVASWGWFYNYHYAPRISDLKELDQMEFKFELGTPFKPFEQLMGVLPAASMEQVPEVYRDLMFSPASPILDFYPLEFERDLNGKKADWEAIVKIPFIEENRLLSAMKTREHRLTAEEKSRNTWGTSTRFTYTPSSPTVFPSSLPGFFPPLHRCICTLEPFDLPTLDGLHLIPGLLDGVFLGKEALAGFPSLKTLPHTSVIVHHGVNVHGQESRNKTLVVHIENPFSSTPTAEVANTLLGKRTFTGWPFLKEGLVVGVSDSQAKYEKVELVKGGPTKVIRTPHSPNAVGIWKGKAEKIENVYSKKSGVVLGSVDVLVHVRPLEGMTPLEDGSLVKSYSSSPDTEIEVALQITLSQVSSEDQRFLEKPAPSLEEEFPEGSKVFFLGEHAYGVAAQVCGRGTSPAGEDTLSVMLAFFPSDASETSKYTALVSQRKTLTYYPSYKAAEMLGISGKALSKITSSFMVLSAGEEKTNLGLSLKFEAKSMKVVEYSRKEGRVWEFSEKAVELIREYKAKYPEVFRCLDASGDAMARASDIFPGPDPNARMREIKSWLKSKGVRDFEPVSLFCDQLTKDTVAEIEKLADELNASKSSTAIRKAIVKGIPRRAVLKPTHAVYRLQNQQFALGDRVTMVRDSGGVPLSAKGVVIGLNTKTMDVVWDVAFMSGTTLDDRCSQYRGLTVEFTSCLNLTNPQFVASTQSKEPPLAPKTHNTAFKPRFGPHPAIQPSAGHVPVSGFRPAPPHPNQSSPVHIMTNPHRGGRSFPNGQSDRTGSSPPQTNGTNTPFSNPRGFYPARGRGSFSRGFPPSFDRGRGRGLGYRGRGRGAAHVQS